MQEENSNERPSSPTANPQLNSTTDSPELLGAAPLLGPDGLVLDSGGCGNIEDCVRPQKPNTIHEILDEIKDVSSWSECVKQEERESRNRRPKWDQINSLPENERLDVMKEIRHLIDINDETDTTNLRNRLKAVEHAERYIVNRFG